MKHVNAIFLTFFLIISITYAQEPEQQPTFKNQEGYYYAAMDFTGSYQNFGANIGQFMIHFYQQNLAPQGPPMGIYFSSPDKTEATDAKWCIAFPVNHDATMKSPLRKGEFKAQTVATCLHIGPYEKITSTYEKLKKFISANGYEISGPHIEQYENDPRTVKPEEIRTLVIFPVKKK